MDKNAFMEPELVQSKMETITKWVQAIDDLLYPNKSETILPCPVKVIGGYNTDLHHVSALAIGVNAVGADLVYVAFKMDEEAKGPIEILTIAVRGDIQILDRNLKLWVSNDGEVNLVGYEGKTVQTFDADGMDKIKAETGKFAKSGYRRASKLLAQSVAASRTPVVSAHMMNAA